MTDCFNSTPSAKESQRRRAGPALVARGTRESRAPGARARTGITVPARTPPWPRLGPIGSPNPRDPSSLAAVPTSGALQLPALLLPLAAAAASR